MDKAIDVHDHVIRTQLGRFNGYEVTTEGDAFLMAFHDASDAIAWTLATQQVSSPFRAVWYINTCNTFAMTATVTARKPAILTVAGTTSTAWRNIREPSKAASVMPACSRPLVHHPASSITRLLMC